MTIDLRFLLPFVGPFVLYWFVWLFLTAAGVQMDVPMNTFVAFMSLLFGGIAGIGIMAYLCEMKIEIGKFRIGGKPNV